ncbi:hypothetical protein M758_12G002300 [Ceratodon purpureus]|uniref:Uncharacterized protein n=1 Tax=Ceratodon purpureus TaxID=3225 RepID=A0A8T0G655_CERPU|nr:hypothetical protein KC19_12G003300 [Ceratodon purpureus]KAG0597529.1 hypothetical protein M758_12G002300 [Ceratodon purpureus]
MIEIKKSRLMELALFCFARAIESFAICVAYWGVLERYNLIPPKRIDIFLFSAATAFVMHCYAQEQNVFRLSISMFLTGYLVAWLPIWSYEV